MNGENMKERIESYLQEGLTIKPDWEAYVKDTTLPLDERWEVFCLAPIAWKFSDPCGPDLPTLCEVVDSPYDVLYMERSESKSIEDTIEMLEEEDYETEEPKATPEQIIAIKEEALQALYGEWTYDW